MRFEKNEMLEDRFNEMLEDRFDYHKVDNAQLLGMQGMRDKCKELAYILCNLVPPGRDQSIALTKLQEVMFWSNCGISAGESKSKKIG